MCQEVWVLCAWAHHIEDDVCLLKVSTPVGEAVRFGYTWLYGNEVVFPSSNGTFRDVGSMNFRRGVLEACIVLGDECFHIMRGFIVEFVQLWLISLHVQVCMMCRHKRVQICDVT